MEAELKRVAGTRQISTIGGSREIVDVRIDPQLLSGRGLSLAELRMALQSANSSAQGAQIVSDNQLIPVRAGTFLVSSRRSRAFGRRYRQQ